MAEALNFVAEQEPMCVYRLEDGSTIRVRLLLMRVERDGSNENGEPQYQVKFQHVMDVEPGPNLKDTPLKKEAR